MNDANNVVHPIGALYTSTVQLVRYSFWLGEQKEILPKQQYKDLLSQLGWENEEKAYLKIKAAFSGFTPYELAQVEPRTIFLIALNFKKYQSVIPQMRALPQITQDKVRCFMKQCHKPRAKKESEEATIWRMMPDGLRAFEIGTIYNQSLGVILEEMMKQEGRTAQSIVSEAIVARYKSRYGFPIKEDTQDSETAPVEEEIAQDEKETAPLHEVTSGNQTAPDYEEVALDSSVYSWDEDQLSAEEDLQDETSSYNPWSDGEGVIKDTWSFEPDEKEDFIEDYEVLTMVDSQPQKMAPVDILIQALRTATSWQEISEALKIGEEYKQSAWNALTQSERLRIIELTPPAIKKLSYAKHEGLIAEFRVEREGVYQVRENGCFIWDIVFEYRVDEYLGRFVNQYQN
jgi:hypothetical protein